MLLAVAGVVAVVAVLSLDRPRPPEAPVSRAEAEALLAETVALVRAGKADEVCRPDAVTDGVCRFLLESAREANWEPGPEAPTVVGVSRREGAMILHVSGVRPDGSRYTGDFEVIREDGEVSARTPVYWSGVRLEPGGECTESPGRVECSAVTSPTR